MMGWAVPVVVLVVATVGLSVGGVPVAPWVAGGAAVVMAGCGVLIPFLAYRNWSYERRRDELILRHGVITKVERWVPRLRIQHVDLIGGPVERSLGLRQLVVYTAGTREADVKVPGLTRATAEALRQDLLEWTRTEQEEEPSPVVDAGDDGGDPGGAGIGSSG